MSPDLWAAAVAAHRVQADAQHGAAWHLLPQATRLPSGYYPAAPSLDLARECAEVARAAGYEARALAAAARGEVTR